MARKKIDVLVEVTADPVQQIKIWVDSPSEAVKDILSIEGILNARVITNIGVIYIMIDPRYDVQEVADEIKDLLTAKIPDVFRE